MWVVGHIHPLAVGAHHLEAGAADDLGHLVLEALPVLPGFGEPAGDDDCGLDPLVGALLQGGDDDFGGDHHHGQLRGLGRVGDGLVDLKPQDFFGFRVDGEKRAGEAAVFEVGQDVVAELAGRGGRADDSHAFRLEDGVQAGQVFHAASFDAGVGALL